MRILHISDTHSKHRELPPLPEADVIVHSGDFTLAGSENEAYEFVVGAQPNCFESHKLDFFFSTRTTFRRLRSLFAAIVVRIIFGTKIGILFLIKE